MSKWTSRRRGIASALVIANKPLIILHLGDLCDNDDDDVGTIFNTGPVVSGMMEKSSHDQFGLNAAAVENTLCDYRQERQISL